MSKRNRYEKSDSIRVDRSLIKSRAFLELKGMSPQVYMLFLLRRKWMDTGKSGKDKWYCSNLREIVFPYREATAKFSISRKQFLCCIYRLVLHGFLDIVKPGIAVNREATIYGISERWKCYKTGNFIKAERPKGTCGYPARAEKVKVELVAIECVLGGTLGATHS
jgi:hypothetical protein